MELTEYESKLLKAATSGDGHDIEIVEYEATWELEVPGVPEIVTDTPRLQTMYRAAFDSLLAKELIERVGRYRKGTRSSMTHSVPFYATVYRPTAKGFEVGDSLD